MSLDLLLVLFLLLSGKKGIAHKRHYELTRFYWENVITKCLTLKELFRIRQSYFDD